MADGFIQLPDDASNTGKKVRTQSRAIGANTVHEHYTAVSDVSGDVQARVLTGVPSQGDPGVVVRQVPTYTSGASRISGDVVVSRGGLIYQTVAILASGDGDTTVISAVAGQRICAYAVKLIATRAGAVKWKDGAASEIEGSQMLMASGGYVEAVSPPAYLLRTSVNTNLVLNVSVGGYVGGRVSYWLEP